LRDIQARIAIEAGRMAVYHRHVGGDFVEPSAELIRFLGFPEGAHPSAEELRSRVWSGDSERIEAAVQTALDRGECFFETEYRWRRPDGDVRWHMVRAEAQRDAHGSPTQFVGVLVDITERKQAEERLALLAREVDHRANNLLAVAQATVRLSKAPTVDDLRATILGRIDALANAHALIAESEWRGADLERLIERELKPYAGEGNANIVVVGPPVALSGPMAQAMAMALHELATNAAKYGAFSTDLGRVEVAWFRTPDAGLLLRWTEIGGPPADPPKGRGLGMKLIEEAAVRQLGGELHLDWRPSGLVCEFRIPGARLATSPVPAGSILNPGLAPEPTTHA
jgi:PAS domain S-box-containing protein